MYNLNPQQEEHQRPPRFAFIVIGLLIVSTIVLVTLVGLKQPYSSTHTGSIEFVKVTQEVVSDEDIVISVNNATVYIPKGAATVPGIISLTPRQANLFSNVAELGWDRSQVVNVEYWNGEGTPYPPVSFTQPVQICFTMTNDLWQSYTLRPDDFQVHYYAEESKPPRWQPLPLRAYADRLQLCGETGHFSIFAFAIRQLGAIPVTGATPTLVQPYAP